MHPHLENKQAEQLSEKIAALPAMNKPDLLEIWSEVFPTPPPPTLRKQLIVPILAYRLQEQAYGGLSLSARKRLEAVAARLPKGPRTSRQVVAPDDGTRILRQWRGQMHEVRCTEESFFYRGEQYGSLSKIAFVITGTKWSGPAFFGVKK